MSHVLAMFPGEADDALILRTWLDLASRTLHIPSGPTRIAIDLGLGVGNGDQTVIVCRDDNGILALEASREWSLEKAAERAAALAMQFNVKHSRISYDAAGIGADFGARLLAVGIRGANPYLGGMAAKTAFNLRSAAGWAFRQRLDPDRYLPGPPPLQPPSDGRRVSLLDGRPKSPGEPQRVVLRQHPFAIRPEFLAPMRRELELHRYGLDHLGRIKLEGSEEIRERLRHSPDYADTLFQSFAYIG
jgi:hypothetical protein